jgi:hypothetical protein
MQSDSVMIYQVNDHRKESPMQKRVILVIIVAFILASSLASALSEDAGFSYIPMLVRPGKLERISFIAPSSGSAVISLTDGQGQTIAILKSALPVEQGVNNLVLDGYDENGLALSPGSYRISLAVGSAVATGELQIGIPSPQITNITASRSEITQGDVLALTVTGNMTGTLSVIAFSDNVDSIVIFTGPANAEATSLTWNTASGQPLPAGRYALQFILTDETGFSSNARQIYISVSQPQSAASTPKPSGAPESPAARILVPTLENVLDDTHQNDYWTLPIGVMDEDAIWKVMIAPITVVSGNSQTETYKLRSTPVDNEGKSNIIGEITFESQGVHILETRDDGWTLIEAFNSSYGPKCASRRGFGNTDELIRGYVRTALLKVISPKTDYGILIDKLTQRMYIFKEGILFSELGISTGFPTEAQPWNETPTGEYLMVSRVGDFMAGNLVCAMGMRINGGSLMHEVPYILNEATNFKDYSYTEKYLGEKASHGCIRVQRKKNSEGLNMEWLWKNIKVNTKVLVWDDCPGRFLSYPIDSLDLYFNPNNGQYYHSDQNCSGVRDKYLPLKGHFTYAELDNEPYSRLIACPSCNPPARKAQIDIINSQNGY